MAVSPPGILEELHEGHPGISKMKSLARCFVWWPGMDKALEEKVKLCDACQRTWKLPPVAPIQPWEWPKRPWARLHRLRWPSSRTHVLGRSRRPLEVKAVTELRSIHGIPELLVSDNGSVLNSRTS